MNDDRRGIDLLLESVETVAADLERRRGGPRIRQPRRWRALAGGLAAAAAIATATGIWLLRPSPAAEVEILELKIHGRPVDAVVVEGRAPGTLVVMPGPAPVSRRRMLPVLEIALFSGGER